MMQTPAESAKLKNRVLATMLPEIRNLVTNAATVTISLKQETSRDALSGVSSMKNR